MKSYDVIIIGGGTSGCAAAYNCARLRLKTLLVEKNNFLGGLMSGGLVVPVMKSAVSDINCDYYKELVKTAKKFNAQITYSDGNDGWFNPEILKIVIEDILTKNGIKEYLDILFETVVLDVEINDRLIKKIILSNKTLSIPIDTIDYNTKFIDSSGSAAFSTLCGCRFINDTDNAQQGSLRFIIGNVDTDKFSDFIKSIDCNRDITNTYRNDRNTDNQIHFTTASTTDTYRIWALDELLQKGVEDNILIDSDRNYFQLFSVAGSASQAAFNCPEINTYKNNPYLASNELINAKKAIWRLYSFCKKYFKGFENSEIINIASQTGLREERRVKTKYIYTKNDLLSGKTFKNPVLRANYSIDIHSDKKDGSILQKTASYELPIEALMSDDIDNLFVAGKILGADFAAHSALRVQKSCMQMGEALAKYIYIQK